MYPLLATNSNPQNIFAGLCCVGILILLFLAGIGIAVLISKKIIPLPLSLKTILRTPVYIRKPILTPRELSFFRVLQLAIGDQYHVAPKIRLADIITPRRDPDYRRNFSRISQKHIDFTLIDKQHGTTILLIELDDRTHLLEHRKQRDQFVDEACNDAGIPILHLTTNRLYDTDILLHKINEIIRPKGP